MELRDYVRVLRKRWASVLLLTLVGVLGAGLASALAEPQYEARTQLFVSTQVAGSAGELLQGSSFTQQRVKSYADVVTSPMVLRPAIAKLGLDLSADELAGRVRADAPIDTVLINIAVRDESPQRAADIANAVGTSFTTVISDLEGPEGRADSPVRISTVQPAEPSKAAVSPNTRLNLLLGLLLGGAVGVGTALLREALDSRVSGEDDVRAVTDANIIGAITYDEGAAQRPLIVHSDPQGARAEAFRHIRTNLQFIDVANQPTSLVITSSVPDEGKSTTAANLAITMAAAGARVGLVEGDLRRPKVTHYLGIDGSVGLTNVLIGQAQLEDVIQPWGNGNLHVLPAGVIPPNPSELVGSASMRTLLNKLERNYDTVIIDAPPLLPVTDSAILTAMTGGAVVVVGSEKVTRDQLLRAIGALEAVGGRVLGIVLNRLPLKGPDAYTYYNYDYRSGESRRAVHGASKGVGGPRRARR